MTTSMAEKAVNQMATAATTLRDAIAAALPVSSTQLMTVQVPGSVIDPTWVFLIILRPRYDWQWCSEFVWTPTASPFVPLDVRIAEAKLVDSQVPISKVMVSSFARKLKIKPID